MEIPAVDACRWLQMENDWARANRTAGTPNALPAVCRQFERVLTQMLVSSLARTAQLEEANGSQGLQESWAWSQWTQTLSQELTRGEGLGLAALLQQQLEKHGK